jgi:hypothetical protein
MSLEQWLALVSVALSLGGLVPVIRRGPDRGLTVASTILALLLGLTSVMVFSHWQHDRKIDRIQSEMSSFLSKREEATFEEIFKNLHTMEEGDAREALLKSAENGVILHEQREFTLGDGRVVEIRYYHLKKQ